MKTEIQAFCNEFIDILSPFSSRLDKTLNALSEKSDVEPLRQTSLRLKEIRLRLSTLQDKVADQSAYLLIFGPLKSGKSTLMNAVSGAYVSEVSSLPAYPALVYVKDGESRKFKASTYDGETAEYKDSEAMSNAIHEAHENLAEKILEIEREGESFDPMFHYPEAIRRIDVEVPAQNLAESGSVLVDTPGLYSRMKFGYDLMTRDFRDTAACAIFVVKTDNLFFEKVFEEFNQLLGCFSRIFLVANIDTSKKDLTYDGSLEPSLESRSPGEIIKAFESLSMSAPLREAYEQGRLNIYTIDLLKAASEMLSGDKEESEALEETEDEDVADDETATDSQAESEEEAESIVEDNTSFNKFLSDLTEYLNSSDYLHEFMYDSLRFGENLGNEAAEVVTREGAESLETASKQLSDRLEQVRSKLKAIETLEKVDWDSAFDSVYAGKDRLVQELSEKYSKKLGNSLQEALDRWMESDDSLNEFQDNYLNHHIEQDTSDDASSIREQISELLGNSHGGARFTNEQIRAFDSAEISIEEISPRLLQNLGEEIEPKSRKISLEPEDIPVKRTFMDYILFRGQRKVQQQLFGQEGDEPISSSKKQKRLAGPGLEKLQEIVAEYPRKDLPEIQQDYVNRVVEYYVSHFKDLVSRQLKSLYERLSDREKECESRMEVFREIQNVFNELRDSSVTFNEAVDELKGKYDAYPRYSELEEGQDESNETAEFGFNGSTSTDAQEDDDEDDDSSQGGVFRATWNQ